ncbi:TetR family transcriptional regulator, partial [Bosea sp. TAB14]
MPALSLDDQGTRTALIRAGLDLFGRHGFEASSIRQIAQAAGVNSAGIAYHFGGKGGLREACAQSVVETIRQR